MTEVIKTLARFVALPSRERHLTARAAALAILTDTALRFMPFKTVAQAMGVRTAGPAVQRQPPGLSPDAAAVARSVDRALRYVPHAHGRCLVRSIVLGKMLKKERPELRIGVQKAGTGIRAHAWLEVDGAAIAEDGVGAFTPLAVSWPSRNTRSTGC